MGMLSRIAFIGRYFKLANRRTETAATTVNFNETVNRTQNATATSTTFIGLNSTIFFEGESTAGNAHNIGLFGFSIMNAVGKTCGLMIGTEGKIEVDAGTVTSAVSGQFGLADNSGTINTWAGANVTISNNNGTLTNGYGHNFQVTSSAVQIANLFGYRAADVTLAQALNYSGFYGLVTNKAGHYNIYCIGDAPAYFQGVVNAVGGYQGRANNTSAAAGMVGEVITAARAPGSALALTTTVSANVTSIVLTAGDWDISGYVGFTLAGATSTQRRGSASLTSATTGPEGYIQQDGTPTSVLSTTYRYALPVKQVRLSGTVTIYLVADATFSAGTVSAFGEISARRSS